MRVVAMLAWPSHSCTLVGLMVERIGGGRRAQRMGADLEPQFCRMRLYQLVDRVGRERVLEGLAAVVFNRLEQRAALVSAVASGVEESWMSAFVPGCSGRNRVFSPLPSTLRCGTPRRACLRSETLSLESSSRRSAWYSSVDRMARSRLALTVSLAGGCIGCKDMRGAFCARGNFDFGRDGRAFNAEDAAGFDAIPRSCPDVPAERG
jgi:hypothetical protein